MGRGWWTAVVLVAAVALVAAAPGNGGGPPFGPVAFEASPASEPVYGVQPPSVDPELQRTTIKGVDGTPIFVETWLPAASGEHVPPERVPVIVSISPYLSAGTVEAGFIRDHLVPRGYAYANVHVRGTGESGGCLDLFGPLEVDHSARAIEYLGRDASFSDGNLGAYGVSYPGGTPLSAAGRGDPDRVRYLKAIVAGAPYHSAHEAQWSLDGVASFAIPATTPLFYLLESYRPEDPPEPGPAGDRAPCQAEHHLVGLDWSGNHTRWHEARDNRAWTGNITAATMMFHGHHDLTPMGGSPPWIQRGLFDQLPDSTPRTGVFGDFGHTLPRADHPEIGDMVIAWFDHWVKGIDVGADRWPTVQVQGTEEGWRTEQQWPTTTGPPGQLALGPGGTLGAAEPAGSTVYVEGAYETTLGRIPTTDAVFETPPLADRLELTGQPVLELWLTLAVPDAHVAARLEVIDADGAPIEDAMTYGLRSAQHLEPSTDGRFTQRHPVLPPVGEPIRVPVRFQPTNLVVPEGGSLRLTIAGSLIVNPGLSQLDVPEPAFHGPSLASGVVAPVTVHHDCETPSTLRFLLPDEDSRPIEFGTGDGPRGRPHQPPAPSVDGGGIAISAVCGQHPRRIEELGTGAGGQRFSSRE